MFFYFLFLLFERALDEMEFKNEFFKYFSGMKGLGMGLGGAGGEREGEGRGWDVMGGYWSEGKGRGGDWRGC